MAVNFRDNLSQNAATELTVSCILRFSNRIIRNKRGLWFHIIKNNPRVVKRRAPRFIGRPINYRSLRVCLCILIVERKKKRVRSQNINTNPKSFLFIDCAGRQHSKWRRHNFHNLKTNVCVWCSQSKQHLCSKGPSSILGNVVALIWWMSSIMKFHRILHIDVKVRMNGPKRTMKTLSVHVR